MPGKKCPNCGKATFYGNQCTQCGFKMIVSPNEGRSGKGKQCPNCGRYTVFGNRCNTCGAKFTM